MSESFSIEDGYDDDYKQEYYYGQYYIKSFYVYIVHSVIIYRHEGFLHHRCGR